MVVFFRVFADHIDIFVQLHLDPLPVVTIFAAALTASGAGTAFVLVVLLPLALLFGCFQRGISRLRIAPAQQTGNVEQALTRRNCGRSAYG